MQTYKMIWSSMIGSLPWEYTWDAASDAMAMAYARLHTQLIMEHSDGGLIDTIVVFKAKDCDWHIVGHCRLKSRIEVEIVKAEA